MKEHTQVSVFFFFLKFNVDFQLFLTQILYLNSKELRLEAKHGVSQ